MTYHVESGSLDVLLVAETAQDAARHAVAQHDGPLGHLVIVTDDNGEEMYFPTSRLLADPL